MAGNTANAGSWAMGDVLIAPLTATNPAKGGAFSTDWKFVGLLDGGQGFEEGRDSDSKKHFAWGGVLVEVSDSKYEQTATFTALENNPVIRQLIYPGSTFTEGVKGNQYEGVEVVPTKEKFKIAFQTQRSDGTIERKITKNYATLSGWPSKSKTEDDLESVKVEVAIFPQYNDATGKYELYDVYAGPKA